MAESSTGEKELFDDVFHDFFDEEGNTKPLGCQKTFLKVVFKTSFLKRRSKMRRSLSVVLFCLCLIRRFECDDSVNSVCDADSDVEKSCRQKVDVEIDRKPKKPFPGVNFINILQAAFLCESVLCFLMCLQFGIVFVISWEEEIGAKTENKMLVESSTVNVINILQTSFQFETVFLHLFYSIRLCLLLFVQ